ncbi:MAG: hypothetical protein ACAI44_22080 [Candidatus Sericytochromatia bacterium]
MHGILLYCGGSGPDRRLAAKVSRSTGFELINLCQQPKLNFDRANPIVLGTGLSGDRLQIGPWLAEHWDQLRARKLVLYTLSDLEPDRLDAVLTQDLSPEMRLRMRIFKLQGQPRPLPRLLDLLAHRLGCIRIAIPLRESLSAARDENHPDAGDQLQPLLTHLHELTRLQNRVTALQAGHWRRSASV